MNTYFSNTIKKHFINQHAGPDLPTCIKPVKEIKALKENYPRLYNSKSFKTYLEAEDEEDSITEDEKKFMKEVKKLEAQK